MTTTFRFSLIITPALMLLLSGLTGCGSGFVVASAGSGTGSGGVPSSPGSVLVLASKAAIPVSTTDPFSATTLGVAVSGGQWVVLGGSTNGTIDANGTYTAPAVVPSPSSVSVEYIVGSATYVGTVSITAGSPGAIIVQAATSTVSINNTDVFTASLQGVPAQGGQWVVLGGSANGSIDLNGLYLAPSLVPSPSSVYVDYVLGESAYTAKIVVQSSGGPVNTGPSAMTVLPTTLAVGSVNLTISGSGFNASDVVLLSGVPLVTALVSTTQLTATGYLAPWTSGSAIVAVAANDGTSVIASVSIPIAPTAVSFDAAARFATQAGLGPRPDVVLHIQQIGFDAFITEQFNQPANDWSKYTPQMNAVYGNSLLRQRVAIALESFMVPHNNDFSASFTILDTTLGTDANGNFRTLLDDIISNIDIPYFLNLPNNPWSNSSLSQPNQNFARELMQLFTLGPVMLNDDGSVQYDGGGIPVPTYGQDTVINLTRAFTGWYLPTPVNAATTGFGLDYSQPLVSYAPDHDPGTKLLFGTVVIPAGQGPVADRKMALDAIFNHPNLPPFLTKLLIQQLVSSNPSPEYIARMSKVFEDDGTGVRGNMGAIVRAILLDPEARRGDTSPNASDGVLQDPYRFELFTLSVLQNGGSDGTTFFLPRDLGESWFNSDTIFGFYTPSYQVPGTTVTSPEFMLFNNLSVVQRSQALWGIVSAQLPGYTTDYTGSSWLYSNFTTVPSMIEALNHLVQHGQMSSAQQALIANYCSTLDPFAVGLQLRSAVFLALNSDSYNVSN